MARIPNRCFFKYFEHNIIAVNQYNAIIHEPMGVSRDGVA